MKIKEWLQSNQHINIKVALGYLILIMMAYSSVVFLGRTLQPILYYSVGLDGITTEVGPWNYQGRTPINTFNIDLATPAYYEWPINGLVGDFYRQGEIPIWNPYQAAGDPLAVQYSSRVFFPYQILENISPTWTWDYFILGRLWFAGFFTFLFLIALRLSILPAFLGGIFYMFSGSLVWFINLEQMANVAMMLPFMMFAMEKLVAQGNGTNIALAAVAMALVLLGGQPEVALYVLALGGLYLGIRSIDLYGRHLGRFLFNSVIAGLLALGLAAFLLLPFIEYMEHAYHMHDPSRNLWLEGFTPWQWLIAVVIPTFFDIPIQNRLGPENGIWDYLGGYIGILPLLLMIFALFQAKSPWRKYLIFFLTIGSCILLKNLGVSPFKYIGALPLFDQTWSQRWAGPVWTFSFAIAAALAVEIIWNKKQREQMTTVINNNSIESHKPVNNKFTQIVWIISGIVIGCLTIFILFNSTLFNSALFVHDDLNEQHQFFGPAVFMGYAVTILTIVIATVIIKYWGDSKSGLYALIALALNELWFVIPKGYPPEFLYFKLIPFIIGLIVVWECGQQRWKRALIGTSIVVFAYGGIDYMAPYGLPDQADPFSPPPYVEFLQEQEGQFRIAGAGSVLMPNFASAVGLYDVRYVSSLSIATYQHFVNQFLRREPLPFYNVLWFTGLSKNADHLVPINVKKFTQEAEKDIRAQLKFYSVLGVKYFVLPRSSNLKRKSIGTSEFRLVYNQEVKIYENLTALPRTFVVHKTERASNYQEAQTLAGHKKFDFRKQGVVEERIPNASRMAQGPNHSHSEIVHYGAKNVELKVQTSRPGLAILTDVYYPGWRAEVNGQPAKIYRVNGLLRGVWLPKGEHQVVFYYWPLSYQVGFALAGLSGLICLVLVMASVFGRKRQLKKSLKFT
ncbi:conserved hypothetical protein, membrane [Beggiatoa sp. PS]|nr:conserved hypothetical protein, membrane [Beggiatoa sp. PS]